MMMTYYYYDLLSIHHLLYISSFLIDQHNETEPAEEKSLELTSEDSETFTEGHSFTSFPCSSVSLSLPLSPSLSLSLSLPLSLSLSLPLSLSLSLSLSQSFMLLKTVFDLARRGSRSYWTNSMLLSVIHRRRIRSALN